MKAKEILQAVMKATGLNQVQIAKMVGMPEQSLGQKVNIRETVKANEFFDILEKIGVDAIFYVRATGETLTRENHNRRRVVGMSDGIAFDTQEAKLLASSFYADGENEFGPDGMAQELYVNKEGRYFVVEYNEDEEVKARIRTVPNAMANAFLKLYEVKEDAEQVKKDTE